MNISRVASDAFDLANSDLPVIPTQMDIIYETEYNITSEDPTPIFVGVFAGFTVAGFIATAGIAALAAAPFVAVVAAPVAIGAAAGVTAWFVVKTVKRNFFFPN